MSLKNKIPTWILRFIKQTGRGINHFNMIKDGDKILLGISGGKDSLSMAYALSKRKKWLPISYELFACLINWSEHSFSEEELNRVRIFFKKLNIPLIIKSAQMNPPSFKGKFNCYLCARNRKRILFNLAREMNIKKIAFGHHMDDIVETTLVNLCFHGKFFTMMPVQDFFKGKIQVIRPLCEVKEKNVINLAEKLNFPVLSRDCPKKNTNIRIHMKPIINKLSSMDEYVREHIYKSPWNIQKDYLPSK